MIAETEYKVQAVPDLSRSRREDEGAWLAGATAMDAPDSFANYFESFGQFEKAWVGLYT